MSKVEQIFRLVRIIKELERNKENGGLTYEELRDRLEKTHEGEYDAGNLKKEEVNFSERTFQRDRKLLEGLFEVNFVYENKKWRLEENDFANRYAFFDNILLVDAYRRTRELSNILLFERQQHSSMRFLEDIIEGIQQNVTIRFVYTKFWEGTPHQREVIPYAVREYKRRWYLIAEDYQGNGQLKSFGLDRVSQLEVTDTKVVHQNIAIGTLFDNAFGITIAPMQEPETIILSFDPDQGQYVKTLPLHHSQQILVDCDKEIRIGLRMVPTYDFVMEICSRSRYVKVLAPDHLAQQVKELLKAGYEQYN